MKPQWLKKTISKREWQNFHSITGTYMKLAESGGDVLVGFMTAGLKDLPRNCYQMNEFELRDFDLFCERENLHPRPFQVL